MLTPPAAYPPQVHISRYLSPQVPTSRSLSPQVPTSRCLSPQVRFSPHEHIVLVGHSLFFRELFRELSHPRCA